MRESFSLFTKSCIAFAVGRRILKPSLILCCISPRMKVIIYGVQAEVCGPLEMEVSSAWGDHGGPVQAGMPSST